MAEWKIDIQNLEYANLRFRLHSLNYKIRPGTITGIIGKNGSGKSTLLKLIHGDLKPDKGEVDIDGNPVKEYGPFDLSRKISFLYQEMYEPFRFTVRDILNVSAYSREESVSSYMTSLEELGIANLADIQFTNLSGGERRLVTIAASVYQDSEIMLLDEPTTYLDIDNQIAVHDMLRTLKERGKTIIVVMHDINAIQQICDEVIMLRSGEVIESGPIESALNKESLKRTFDVPFSEVTVEKGTLFVHRSYEKH